MSEQEIKELIESHYVLEKVLVRRTAERDALRRVYETCLAYHNTDRTDSAADRLSQMIDAIQAYEKEFTPSKV